MSEPRTEMKCLGCGGFSSTRYCWHCSTSPLTSRVEQLERELAACVGERKRLRVTLKMREDAEDPAMQAYYKQISEEDAPTEKPKCSHVIAYADPKDAIPCPVCERDDLRTQLAAARAEVERLKQEQLDEADRMDERFTDLRAQLAATKEDADRLAGALEKMVNGPSDNADGVPAFASYQAARAALAAHRKSQP